MQEQRKAQLTVGLLACFAISWGLFQDALNSSDKLVAFSLVVGQLIAIIIIAIILMSLLEWVDVFDLKINAVLTLLVLVSIRLLSTI